MFGFNGEPHDEDDEFKQSRDLNDWSYDGQEDYQKKTAMTMRYKPEDMQQPQFLTECMASKIRGGLNSFLGALGITDEIGVTKVERILDENFPTLLHKSDILFEMMEHEFASMCLGSVTRVGDMNEEGEFFECSDIHARRLQALQMLYKLRMTRLKLREDINKMENPTDVGPAK